jgi:protein TonB
MRNDHTSRRAAPSCFHGPADAGSPSTQGHTAQGDVMSSTKRNLRTALHCLAGLALACAALAPGAQAQQTNDAENSAATIDFASCAKPVYPQADMQAGHQGTVTLGFLVDEMGRVKDSKVMKSTGFRGLDMTAQVALGKCSFHPARENGKPVEKWAQVQYVWTLP